MIILDLEQGSEEWHAARRGIPTASQFKRVVTAAKGDYSKSSDDYACELVAERLGHTTESFITDDMQHGIDTEAEARAWAEMELDADITQVGLVLTDDRRMACSPDGLLYYNGTLVSGIEIKCPRAKTHLLWQDGGELPDVHKAQVHGSMAVTGLNCWYFMSYVTGLEPFLIAVERDGYTTAVAKAVEMFCKRVDILHKRFK